MAKTILIADDDPNVVNVLGIRLIATGYNVIAAYDGIQIIELSRQEKPDFIILDIKMPCADDYSVFKSLKTSANTMSIPIVFYSGLPPELVQEKAAQLGAGTFISKSDAPDEILAKITEILDQSQSQPVKQI
ncbi:MAG: response regulator [Phycisphaerae bacterium]